MKTQTSASPRRLTVGAVLLILAATASSCGTALPTQPDLDSGASIQRGGTTTLMTDTNGPVELEDLFPPTGGSDQTQMPPAGEEQLPSLTHQPSGNAWGWHRKQNR